MPNWKKLIVSGSAGNLSSLSVDTSISASTISANQFTGSLYGTASQAVSSSYAATASSVNALNQNVLITGSTRISGSLTLVGLSPISVSHVKANDVQGVEILTNTNTTVATFGAGGGTGVTVVGQINATSFSGSGASISGVVSSSYALTASYALNGGSGGGATTGSNTFSGSQTISGSLTVTGSASANIFLYPQTASNVVVPAGCNGLLLTPVQLQGTSSVEIGSRLIIL